MNDSTFEKLSSRDIPSLNVTFEEYRHPRTGARHLHLASEDTNNAFMVAFLTVPQDSTGVAHILEHTALCGSRHYPVRDPFFMMTRRSLSTFMNAFTSSDWTAYPFASQNEKDFDNLLQVYLDAAFFPNLHELDFAQEGHRVEFAEADNADSELVFKGVVYNEMKGAMSSAVSRLWQLLQENLFPTNTYHYNSGGEPEQIPDLTYEDLLAFHRRHYHPSNAIFLTYGNLPASWHQERFEKRALKEFDRLDIDLRVPAERRYTAPVAVESAYPLEGEDDTRDRTHIVMGWLLDRTTDLKATLEAHLLSGVLLDNSASPLRQALETTDLGAAPSELCGFSDSTMEGAFMCGLEGSNPESADAVEQLILGVLEKVAAEGVEQDMVESVLHQLELSQREISGGRFPYGLRLMINALGAAIHGGDAAAVLDLDWALATLREDIKDTDFIPGLTRRLLLDNPHRVRVVMAPDTELARHQQAREKARLAVMKEALDEPARQAVIARAGALEARQMTEDDPSMLPKVGLEDVAPDLVVAEGSEARVGDLTATWFGQGTNGLVYTHVVVELPELSKAQEDLLPVFCDCVTEVGAGNQDYLETQRRQAAVTGGVNAGFSMRGAVDDVSRTRGFYTLSSKALVRNTAPMVEMLQTVYERPRFDELARLRELVSQLRLQREMGITDHGHALAMAAAAAGLSPSATMAHRWNGLEGIRTLKRLDTALREPDGIKDLSEQLEGIRDTLLKGPRRLLVVAEDGVRDEVLETVSGVWRGPMESGTFSPLVPPRPAGVVKEGWAVNTQVNFCARAYPTVAVDHADAAALMVLGRFLTNGFLHRAIREQGGAYGSGGSYDSDAGAFRFFSYRDPRVEGTLDDFERSVDWLLSARHEPRQVEEAILGVIGAVDRPESPAGEAVKAFYGELHGRDAGQRRRLRSRLLEVNLEDLQRVGETWLRPEAAHTAVVSDRATLERVAPQLGLNIQAL